MLAIALIVGCTLASPSSTPSTEAAPPAKRRLILLDLASNGVHQDTVRTLGDVLSTELARRPIFEVVTAADIRAMTDVEASKQELASTCTDESCIAQIATALGADVIVHGSVGELGPSTVVAVFVFDASAARALARERVQADDLKTLGAKVERAAARLADVYQGQAPRPYDDAVSLGTVLFYGGGAAAGVGFVALAIGSFLALGSAATLDDPDRLRADKDRAGAAYPAQTGLAIVGGTVAVAGGGVTAASMVIE